MALDPDIRSGSLLVSRVKGILLEPKLEWPKIASVPATVGSLYTSYIVPLAGFAVLCSFLRDLMGTTVFGVTYRASFTEALTSAIWMLAASLVGAFVVSLVMDWLAPRFGGQSDRLVGGNSPERRAATASGLRSPVRSTPRAPHDIAISFSRRARSIAT